MSAQWPGHEMFNLPGRCCGSCPLVCTLHACVMVVHLFRRVGVSMAAYAKRLSNAFTAAALPLCLFTVCVGLCILCVNRGKDTSMTGIHLAVTPPPLFFQVSVSQVNTEVKHGLNTPGQLPMDFSKRVTFN